MRITAVVRGPSVAPPPGFDSASFTERTPAAVGGTSSGTVNVFVVSPGPKVSVPLVAV